MLIIGAQLTQVESVALAALSADALTLILVVGLLGALVIAGIVGMLAWEMRAAGRERREMRTWLQSSYLNHHQDMEKERGFRQTNMNTLAGLAATLAEIPAMVKRDIGDDGDHTRQDIANVGEQLLPLVEMLRQAVGTINTIASSDAVISRRLDELENNLLDGLRQLEARIIEREERDREDSQQVRVVGEGDAGADGAGAGGAGSAGGAGGGKPSDGAGSDAGPDA